MRFAISAATLLAVVFCLVSPEPCRGELASEQQMERVCWNWLAYMVHQSGGWAGDVSPRIAGVDEIISRSGEMVLARCFSIAPQGHVVVPILMELPPIKAYSEEYGLDVEQTFGFPQLLREVLEHRLNLYIRKYGSLDAVQPPGDVLFDRVNRQEWTHFLTAPDEFVSRLEQGELRGRAQVGPLLSSSWYQGGPYNNFCPMGDGDRCIVGCVATATAQIMNYHRWPAMGAGSHTYNWDGDDSCDPGAPVGGGPLSAGFSDPYDWANMPDDCSGGCSQVEKDALAELCYEVGVALEMDYGACGSSTPTSSALDALPAYFRYDTAIDREDRDGHTAGTWFSLIQAEINASRPILYRIKTGPSSGHAVVCDGWADTGGQNQYHINYGWGGSHTEWFAIDNIYGAVDPMEEYLIRNIQPLVSFIVQPEPSQTVCPDDDVMLHVEIDAAMPAYQWRRGEVDLIDDGVHISGATTDTLWIFGFTSADEDNNYNCVVYDAATDCYAFSDPAEIVLDAAAPVITEQPEDVTAEEGTWAVFHVGIDSAFLFDFQWRKGGVELSDGGGISGVATDTLLIVPLELGDAGDYDCIVTSQLGNQCSIASDSATLTVNPVEYTLTVNVVGNGSVVRNPDQATYGDGQTVELTANADAGWFFDHWEGDLAGSTNPDTIVMDADKTVTAVFGQYDYTLTVDAVGRGSVELDPPGGTYPSGTSVELTANAAGGWHFDHWEGDLTGSNNPETIVLSADMTVTAVFEADCFGDITGDGRVNISDLALLLSAYGTTGGATYLQGDLNGDGDINLPDLAQLLAVYGTVCW